MIIYNFSVDYGRHYTRGSPEMIWAFLDIEERMARKSDSIME